MTSKHDKYQYEFHEENTPTNEPYFTLPKAYHEDTEAPLLVLRNELSDGSRAHSNDSLEGSALGGSNGTLGNSSRLSGRTTGDSIGERTRDGTLEPFAQECLHLFNGEFTVMHHKSFPPQQQQQNAQQQQVETEQQQQQQQENNSNQNLFPKYQTNTVRQSCPPSSFSSDQHLLLKSHGIRFQCRFNEPLFCSLELVDVKHKKRISERIWFHRNTFAMVNEFYEDLEMKRKVKDNGTTGGNVIFSISNQNQRSNDIYVVLWVWRTLSAQTHDQTYGKNILFGKKSTILTHQDRNDDDGDNSSVDGPTMTSDNVGLKPYLTPLCVSFAPLTHQGNNPSMKLTSDNIFTNDGFMTAVTHFLPPCSYHELFTQLIPSIQNLCSFTVTARPSHVSQVDVLLQTHVDQLSKNVIKKHKGVPGWFLFQVQGFNPHKFETDQLYRAYSLHSDQVIMQKMSYLQLRDAIYDMQQFNETKYEHLQQQLRMMEEEMEQKRGTPTTVNKRRSVTAASLQRDNATLAPRFPHLSREPKSYLPLLVPELLPNGVAPASPFFTFVHTLHIYPFSVDFTKLRLEDKPKMRPRNILLEITTREENGQTVSRIYPLHYSQANRSALHTSYFCSVTYENKTPHFVDECKIELPLPIKSHNQRVVFNFYHLLIEKTFNKRKKSMDENASVPKVLLATCELSMFDLVNRSEQCQNLSLPLMKPNHNQLNSEEKYFDPRVNVFKLTTQIESTIYPREKALATFFQDCSPILNVIDKERTPNVDMKFISEALKKAIGAIKALLKIPFNRIVSHYTLIIDMLISVMCRTPDVLKNFVETFDESSMRQSTGSNSGSSNRSSRGRKSVAANRGSVSVENTRVSRGSIKVENLPNPSIQLVLDGQPTKADDSKKNRFSVIANAFLRKSKNMDMDEHATNPQPSVPLNIPKPGDEGFDLKEYLSKIQQPTSNPPPTTSVRNSNTLSAQPSPNRNSGVFNRLRSGSFKTAADQSPSAEDKKKRRFSVFNFGADKKKDEPAFTAIPDPLDSQLDELAERQARRSTQNLEEQSLSNDIGDFLSVSQHLFDAQNLAFQALITLLKGACFTEDTSSRQNKLISSYLQYIFKDVIMTTSPFCFILCESWTNLLSNADDSIMVRVEENSEEVEEVDQRSSRKSVRASVQQVATISASNERGSYRSRMTFLATESPMFFESLNLCWFWFDMMLKSFMITVETERKKTSFYSSHYSNALQSYNKQADKFYILLKDVFKTLADKIVQYREDNFVLSQSVNKEVGNMLKDLISTGMFPPTYIFQLLDTYLYALEEPRMRRGRRVTSDMTQIDQTPILKLKIELIHILSDHPFFFALNNPAYHPSEYMKESLICPPVKLLAICTQSVLESKDPELHQLLVNASLFLMSKLEQTSTLIGDQKREYRQDELQTVARVMFPFVVALVKNSDALLAVDKVYSREYCKCVAYILRTLSESERVKLLIGEAESDKRKQTIRLLSIMLSTFTAEDVSFISMTLDLFAQLSRGTEWIASAPTDVAPSETAYARFLQNATDSDPLGSHVCFFIAQLLQKISQIADLKKTVTKQLPHLLSLIQSLIDNKILGTNCYWRWIYACLCSNYVFVTQKQDVTEFDQFLEDALTTLHSVYGSKIGIDDIPPVIEEFMLPTGVKAEAQQARSSVDEVSEFGVPTNAKLSPSPLESSELSISPSSASDDTATTTEQTVVEYENGVIRSGSLEQLVWRLVRQETVDNKYPDTFFLTYRSFCTPSQVLMHIIAQFRHIAQYSDRWHEFTVLRLLNAFKNWITNHPYDFSEDLFANIILFFKRDLVEYAHAVETIFIMPNMGSNPNTATAYLATINRLKNNIIEAMTLMSDSKGDTLSETVFTYSFSTQPPQPILPIPNIVEKSLIASIDLTDVAITDWSPTEIARQMTLIEYGIFSVIKPKECFNLGWSKSDKHLRSPNIVKLIDQFNKVSSWIATLIIREDTPKKRGQMIKHWIDVADECRQLANLNGVNTVVSALNNSGVHRLKKSWDCVSQKRLKVFKELTDLVSMTASYRNLRQAIQQISPPCVPYIGVYLTDLTFIEDGNKDVTKLNLINFAKRRQIARVIMNIRTLQQQPYNFIVVPVLHSKLTSCEGSSDDSTLYKQSLVIEPRE